MENQPQPAPEPATKAHEGTPHYGEYGHPTDATAAATPPPAPDPHNLDTAAVEAAQGGTEAEERAAYSLDDPRYAGGDVYDLKNEQTSL